MCKESKTPFPELLNAPRLRVKMRIAPCEVDMVCPKCGLIKENVFFLQALMGDTEKSQKKTNKKIITCS